MHSLRGGQWVRTKQFCHNYDYRMLYFKPRTNGWGVYLTHQSRPASLSPYLLQGMALIPHPRPWALRPRAWAALLPETLPYIIQILWLPDSWLLHLTPIFSFTSLPPLPEWPSSVLLCPLWVLPDVPIWTYTVPFIYNKLPPLPYQGAIMSFLFLFIYLFIFHS